MKLHTTLMASCALALIGTTAMADCAEDLARLQSGEGAAAHGEGIAKDGSLAPLETPADAAASAGDSTAAPMEGAAAEDMADADMEDEAEGEGIAKDGSLAPLEGSEGEAGTARAMSGQDVQAQQEGEPTAAEAAEEGETSKMDDDMAVADTDDMASDGEGEMASDEAGDGSMPDRAALIEEAQAALNAGDEEACRAAVDQIEAL